MVSTRQPAWGNSSSLIKLLGRESSRRGLRRRGRGTCGEDKVPVSAFIERGGRMLITAAKDVTEETILAPHKAWKHSLHTSPPTRFLTTSTGMKPSTTQ